ncbi:MAG TPA: metallopeptidase TldD-related protein, partial [Gemmatimonadaceae bacterium]
MSDELARNFTALKSQPTPAYFLSYEITDTRSATVSSAFGALSNSGENHHRQVSITLRVGSYAFDNTHPVRGSFARADALLDRFSSSAPIPVDDDPAAIRNVLWLQTDRRYKTALQQLAGARTNARVAVAAEDNSGDYSAAPVMSYSEPVAPFQVDRAAWEKRLRSYTAPFARYGDIYDAVASLEAKVETRWYVNSEGTQVQVSEPAYRIVVVARSKADDGMELPRYETFYASSLAGLPGDNTILDAVGRMITDLHALRVAPVVDPYTGPAILSGRAAAVFFHEVFGHRVEGQRQKGEDEAQTFKKRINERVLPENFSVVFDPTARRLGSVELMGSYRYDDEGVAARPVTIVQNGTLKSFLMSRTPIDGIPVSNGHGRAQVGLAPVARQSNLIVQVSHPVSHDDLKKMLIDEIKKENKPFGLLFDDIEGGFTITQRFIPNAFNVLPVMVYRVFPDGRQELVRGVDLIGTPLTTFSKIAAADNDVATFNGICGAESGAVPVSASSPGLFISQVEVQKKIKSQESPPILPAPLVEPAAPSNDALVRAMRDELARSIQRLRLDTLPRPYFISYRVTESKGRNALAHLGSLQGTSESGGGRLFQVEVHVGDYAFDNTNYFGAGFLPQAFVGLSPLVEDDDYQEMRRQMWVATDRAYKQALEAVAQKRAALETRTRTDSVADFSKEPVTNTADDVPPPATTDRKPLEALARELSAAFRQSPEIYNSTVGVQEFWSRDTYLNSEGTFFTRSRIHAAVNVSASTQALDGTAQSMAYSVLADSFRALPGKDSLLKGVKDLATRLAAQRRVPVADAYDGPMLFEGKAAAELFNAMIASKLVGSRRPVTSPMFA